MFFLSFFSLNGVIKIVNGGQINFDWSLISWWEIRGGEGVEGGVSTTVLSVKDILHPPLEFPNTTHMCQLYIYIYIYIYTYPVEKKNFFPEFPKAGTMSDMCPTIYCNNVFNTFFVLQ